MGFIVIFHFCNPVLYSRASHIALQGVQKPMLADTVFKEKQICLLRLVFSSLCCCYINREIFLTEPPTNWIL